MRNKIVYDGRTFTTDNINSVKLHLATSLLSKKLEANTLMAIVVSDDKTITQFVRNTPLTFYHRDRQRFIAYVQNIDRVGPRKYKIYGTSAIGRLMERAHTGGMYTGQTAEQIIGEICGPIPHVIKNNIKNVKLYGWLPYVKPPKTSARDNLSQVLFALGATIKTDLDGTLHIEGLWDGISSSIGKSKTYKGASIGYSSPVTSVIVTEHQYIEGGESKKLFEGTAVENDVITFSEPMYDLSSTGFSILESGANYAIVSAGTGVLTGNKYIHNTRQITKEVSNKRSTGEENTKSISDATLVSLVNSTAVAERMANYYACLETINGDVVINSQIPGDVVEAYHPYNDVNLPACIESLDITASGILRAKAKQLVGFSPLRANVGYYDTVDIIQEDGNWTVPEGVTSIRVVLIGGGQGGWSGLPGSDGANPDLFTSTDSYTNSYSYLTARTNAPGGEGGVPGNGGEGGRVFIISLTVTPGTTFNIKIGSGGIGGIYSAEGSIQGSLGTETTFGEYSSGSGTVSPNGFFEETSGEIFAGLGAVGIKGGNGSGRKFHTDTKTYDPIVNGEPITVDGITWYPGANKESEVIESKKGSYDNTTNGAFTAQALGGFGGGAAVGSNGGDGYSPADSDSGAFAVIYNSPPTFAQVKGAKGGKGGNAQSPKPQTKIGYGGLGGNGGGGGGSPGQATIRNSVSKTSGAQKGGASGFLQTSEGGSGSDGGKGGPGGVIIYYSLPKSEPFGPFMDKNKRLFIDRERRQLIV